MKNNDERTLTRAEMEIMNVLWDGDKEGMTTHAIIERYPEPRPAYSTIATFLKILTTKEFISFRKADGAGKTYFYFPLIGRDEYTRRVMNDVKTTFFGGSFKSLVSFFAKEENISDEELRDIVEMIGKRPIS